MNDFDQVATELADMMDEYRLAKCEAEGEGWKVAFGRKVNMGMVQAMMPAGVPGVEAEEVYEAPAPAAPVGTPINSPMAGIFYHASGPSSPAFVKEGETVTAGQVVGLIEAMKVFNEITAPFAGIVDRFAAENSAIVNPGEPLLYLR